MRNLSVIHRSLRENSSPRCDLFSVVLSQQNYGQSTISTSFISSTKERQFYVNQIIPCSHWLRVYLLLLDNPV